jgi:hypothetical protein
VLSEEDSAALHRFAEQRGRLVLTGTPDEKLEDIKGAIRLPDSPERSYLEAASSNFDGERPADVSTALQNAIDDGFDIKINAPRGVVAHAAHIGAKTYVFLANFTGLQAGVNATPSPQSDVSVTLPARLGVRMHVLPFLGTESVVAGRIQGRKAQFALPTLERGAAVWFGD